MKPLREIIEALGRELAGGDVRRVTVTLRCAVVEESGQPVRFAVVTSADTPGVVTHEVCVELGGGSGRASASSMAEQQEKQISAARCRDVAATGDNAVALLTKMFGPPGFDNAARASVFVETIEGLTEQQLSALL